MPIEETIGLKGGMVERGSLTLCSFGRPYNLAVLTRPFGKVIHDLAQNYNGSLAVSEFRKLEKLATKSRKAELDVQFLKNCQAFGVYPKFISFDLPNVCNSDAVYIRKRLLRTSILRRTQEKKKLDTDLEK